MQPELSQQREKFALLLVVLLDSAGEDFVVPAVNFEVAVEDGAGDGGLGSEVCQLGDDVAANDRGEFGLIALFRAQRLAVGEGSLDVVQPAAGFGKIFQALRIQCGLERAAVGVAAEDGVTDLEDFDGVFDGGGDAVDFIAGDGDDVTGVAGDEEVAGLGLEDEVGDDAGVRTGDEEVLGRLRLGEEVEVVALFGEDFFVKAPVSLNQIVHRFI
jgi:hypothetical protein